MYILVLSVYTIDICVIFVISLVIFIHSMGVDHTPSPFFLSILYHFKQLFYL
jgi:hypothetical protein